MHLHRLNGTRPPVLPTPYYPLGWRREHVDFRRRGGFRRTRPPVIPQPRERAVALLSVLILSMLLAASAYSAMIISNAATKSTYAYELQTRLLYGAEGALQQSLYNLRGGGDGVVGPVDFDGVTIAATVEDEIITARADSDGLSHRVRGYVVLEPIVLPKVGAVHVSSTTILTFNGQALSLDGQEEFAIVADEAGGANETALIGQIDPDQWDNIVGQEAAPSIGEAPPVDVDGLFSELRTIAETGTMELGTEVDPRVTYHMGDLHLAGSRTGAGILLVDGDLDVTGSFEFVGLIIVRGSIRLAGGGDQLFVIGSLAVTGDLEVSGTTDVFYDAELLTETETFVNASSTLYHLAAKITL